VIRMARPVGTAAGLAVRKIRMNPQVATVVESAVRKIRMDRPIQLIRVR
jgi:hypothetical protein